jgi:type IV pilus assembly protein PilE
MQKLFREKAGCAGFTLIELMITVAIVGILAAVAVPAYFNHVMRSRQALAVYELLAINAAQERFYAENGSYAQNFGPGPGGLSQYGTVVTKVYVGKYFTYTLPNSVVAGASITATADLDGNPDTVTTWQLRIGEIGDKPNLISPPERFGWSSLAALFSD